MPVNLVTDTGHWTLVGKEGSPSDPCTEIRRLTPLLCAYFARIRGFVLYADRLGCYKPTAFEHIGFPNRIGVSRSPAILCSGPIISNPSEAYSGFPAGLAIRPTPFPSLAASSMPHVVSFRPNPFFWCSGCTASTSRTMKCQLERGTYRRKQILTKVVSRIGSSKPLLLIPLKSLLYLPIRLLIHSVRPGLHPLLPFILFFFLGLFGRQDIWRRSPLRPADDLARRLPVLQHRLFDSNDKALGWVHQASPQTLRSPTPFFCSCFLAPWEHESVEGDIGEGREAD